MQKSILSYFSTPKRKNPEPNSSPEQQLTKKQALDRVPVEHKLKEPPLSPPDLRPLMIKTPIKYDSYKPPMGDKTPIIINKPKLATPVPVARPPTSDYPENRENSLHLTYKFLYPPERIDINKRSPDHPDYDETTLHVPTKFLDSQTPAMRQWWLIKQRNMDAVLFFKMGKFYELFNEDATIGVNNLDLIYMKGDETKPAHAGFPEIAYEKYSRSLVEKGFKVLRVEQTETPAMMEERCRQTGRKGKFDKIVEREVCQVTTLGTQMPGVLETSFHTNYNQYLMAIKEVRDGKQSKFGVSFIDITIGRLFLGQFEDDNNYSKLNILVSHYKPTEVLINRTSLTQPAHQALSKTGALITNVKPKDFWPPKKSLAFLNSNNISIAEWPEQIRKSFDDEDADPRIDLDSFGCLVYYLKSQMIVAQSLNCVTVQTYESPLDGRDIDNLSPSRGVACPPMVIDHIALKNLEIFENSIGTSAMTLYQSVNHCKTPSGQRLLRQWLCSPLCGIQQIENRLDAIDCLMRNENASFMNEILHMLSQTPDLERLLSKMKSQCFKSDSDARAILFDCDQYSKAKISSFLSIISNFKRIQKFVNSIKRPVERLSCGILRRLLTFTTDGGLFPEYSNTIDYFESSFDHEIAKKTGRIVPSPGVDTNHDECQRKIQQLKDQLDGYLEEQKSLLKCRRIEYFGSAKNRYQIQVPEDYCKNVPSEYRIETTRKGFKRYYTSYIDKTFAKLTTYEEELKRCLDGIMSNIFEQFARKVKVWTAAIDCISLVDVLQSLATFSRSLIAYNIPVCRPHFSDTSGPVVINYKDGRHPAILKTCPNFTPNDLTLDNKTVLLSGANMGGKSTLMRQTSLLVILAQIGCYVPASEMTLSPVDRIFSRLGASDRLVEGESTFYTELNETSAMIRCATRNSLLLLDELGRGTSTFDGTAIAYAVLEEISKNIKCRCLFSTHYHTLVKDFEFSENVRLAHMACKVEKDYCDNEADKDPLDENIVFLYKISHGPVARSYGFNVAKLAGIKSSIIKDSFEKARELEKCCMALELIQNKLSSCNLSRVELKRQVLNELASS